MRATILLLAATVLFTAIVFATVKDLQRLDLLVNLWQMVVLGYAAIKLFLVHAPAATAEGKRVEKTSVIFGLACGVWAIGHFLITYFEIIVQQTSYGNLADGFYLVGNSICIYAAASFFFSSLAGTGSGVRRRNTALLCAAILAILLVLMGPLLFDPHRHWSWKALDVIYPSMDLVVAAFLLLSSYSGAPEVKAYGTCIAAAFTLIGVGDVLFAYNTSFDSLLYRAVDSIYSVAYLFIAMATDWGSTARDARNA